MASNPLSIKTTELPPTLILMAKLIAIGMLCQAYLFQLSDYFLPLIPWFDHFGPSPVFEKVLQALFLFSTISILCNYRVRQACIILGLVFLITPITSIIEYRNSKVYCGFILLLAGLYKKDEIPWLLRYQVIILYFGAGLNKLLDPHWQGGQYFEHWMMNIIENKKYIMAASWFPAMMLSKIMCWSTIVGEFFVAFCFMRKRFVKIGIWTGLTFHTMAVILTHNDFGIFTIAVLSSYLCFVDWPKNISIHTNAKYKTHILIKNIFTLVDVDHMYLWQDHSEKNFKVSIQTKDYSGFIAIKKLIVYNPLFYFIIALLLGIAHGEFTILKVRLAEILWLIFFPIPEIFHHLRKKLIKSGDV